MAHGLPLARFPDDAIEGLLESERHSVNLVGQVPAFEGKAVVAVGDGVAQTAHGMDQARLARAHGQQLADAAWLIGTGHYEKIAGGIEGLGAGI